MINPDRLAKLVAAIQVGDIKVVRLMLKSGIPANHVLTDFASADRQNFAHLAAEHA